MEFEVRVVGGMESCFVSLPLSLIQTLQSRFALLPHFLALELRSRDDSVWHVAWSGSASAYSAIEVSQQFAKCIGLSDHITVQVLAMSNLPKATQVTIEPDTEDDWEVMELNSEHAEAAILKQVGVLYTSMRFPLWLHGRTVVTFLVVSIFPKKSVVQLVPGTEVSVAPKGRRKIGDHDDGCEMRSPNEECSPGKTLLRVQDLSRKFVKKCVFDSAELGVHPTSVAFIHPETAKKYSMNILQLLVIMPKSSSQKSLGNAEQTILKKKNSADLKVINSDILTDDKALRQATVQLLVSESVAAGHIMLARSLRLYLRAGLCSWVYVRSCNIHVRKDLSSLSLSPCQFKMSEDKYFDDNTLVKAGSHKNYKSNKKSFTGLDEGNLDWTMYEDVIACLHHESNKTDDAVTVQSENRRGLQSVLQEWFLAQLDTIKTYTGVQVNSLILGDETLLHVEVKLHNLEAVEGLQASLKDTFTCRSGTGGLSAELLYVLASLNESLPDGKVNGYELVFNDGHQRNDHRESLCWFENLNLHKPIIFYSSKEAASKRSQLSTVSSFSLTETTVSDITNRLVVLLSQGSQIWFGAHNIPLPGHVLVYGPPGSGKTTLINAIAKYIEESENLLAYIVFVSCSELALEKAPSIHQALSGYISEALDHTPSLVIFDDLDSLVSSTTGSEGFQPPSSVVRLTQFLADIIDEYAEKRVHSCGIGPVAFLASAQTLENLPQSLTSSGRFDFHVQLSSLVTSQRFAILKHEVQRRLLHCPDDLLLDISSKCDGYDAYDLVILVDRAVHAAIGRFVSHSFISEEHHLPSLVSEDFSQAMHEFLPVAMRDIYKPASEVGHSGWENVGGLANIRNAIKEMIEWPSKFPNIFAQAPLRLRSNVLLYGPPGCGKTHIVGAAAAAYSLRFISVKGPELLNKYIGASEQAVRDIFSKAAAAAPCLLFFDEFDSIAPKRGHDNTGVTDRVVNQFLTELDGVEALTGVFVFAASSRPDLLDAALLRPGRLDRLLFCDFPSQQERSEILSVLSRKLPLVDDVDLDAIARITEGFSGADLQALLSDAQLAAVHDLLGRTDATDPGMKPAITNALLLSIASKASPSVSEAEKRRLYSIYNQFLDSKVPVAEQSRDAKGKRATLA